MVGTIRLLQAKIHRATVTHADVHYIGSIALPLSLLEATGIRPLQEVEVWNVTNGERFATYAVGGAEGEVRVLGSAARRVAVGDILILATFVDTPLGAPADDHRATIAFVDGANRLTETKRVGTELSLWSM